MKSCNGGNGKIIAVHYRILLLARDKESLWKFKVVHGTMCLLRPADKWETFQIDCILTSFSPSFLSSNCKDVICSMQLSAGWHSNKWTILLRWISTQFGSIRVRMRRALFLACKNYLYYDTSDMPESVSHTQFIDYILWDHLWPFLSRLGISSSQALHSTMVNIPPLGLNGPQICKYHNW